MVCNHVSSTILTIYLILWIQTLTFNPFSFLYIIKTKHWISGRYKSRRNSSESIKILKFRRHYQTPVCVSGNNGFDRAATRVATTIQVPGPNKEFIRNGLPKNRRRGNYKTCILLMISVKWKSMSMRWLNWNK